MFNRSLISEMKDWSCKSKRVRARDPVCPESQRQNCLLSRVVYNNTCERRFSTCFQCPSTYPWLGNPDGNLFEVRVNCGTYYFLSWASIFDAFFFMRFPVYNGACLSVLIFFSKNWFICLIFFYASPSEDVRKSVLR